MGVAQQERQGMENDTNILTDIFDGQHDDQLREIVYAVRDREKALATKLRYTLKVGDPPLRSGIKRF